MKMILLIVVASMTLLAGCTNVGHMSQSTGTDVNLSSNNYTIVKAGARGESQGFSLLGFIPIVSPSFADAKTSLYNSVGTNLVGRSIALANQTEDQSSMYLILFSVPKLIVTADVVEFNDPSRANQVKRKTI